MKQVNTARDHDRHVLIQAALQPAGMVGLVEFAPRLGRHVYDAIFDVRVVRRCIIGKHAEGAAAAQVVIRVMPVAGQHSVLHGAAMQRITHVGAAIVYRERFSREPEHRQRGIPALYLHDFAALEFSDRCGADP
ncbi:MAG TPA: hypothetical protein VEJ63_16040 [Planctomycetota bacterium]|nr:hypothetical protein [Planctomycetota bacterium]